LSAITDNLEAKNIPPQPLHWYMKCQLLSIVCISNMASGCQTCLVCWEKEILGEELVCQKS